MGDIADEYRALDEIQRQKRADNTQRSTAYLAGLNIPFESKNHGAHLIVAGVVDFWPSTGLWIPRDPKHSRGRGVRNLLNYLQRHKKASPEGK